VSAMPHQHSLASLQARRHRAAQRGFLRPRPHDRAFVMVPSDFADKVRAVSRSLLIHGAHCKLAGKSIHFANTAAAHVRPLIGDLNYKEAKKAHSDTNDAKHSWADIFDNAPADSTEEDPLFSCDPWAASPLAPRTASGGGPLPSSSPDPWSRFTAPSTLVARGQASPPSSESCESQTCVWHHEVPVFVPAASGFDAALGHDVTGDRQCVEHLQQLVHAQNATIISGERRPC